MSEPIFIDVNDFKHKDIQTLMEDRAIAFSMKGAFDVGSVWFRMHMKPIIVDIDIPEPSWMRYKKCEKCGNYVLHEPVFIPKFIGGRGRSYIDKMAWDYTLVKMQRECENFPLWYCQACSNREHLDIIELLYTRKMNCCCIYK